MTGVGRAGASRTKVGGSQERYRGSGALTSDRAEVSRNRLSRIQHSITQADVGGPLASFAPSLYGKACRSCQESKILFQQAVQAIGHAPDVFDVILMIGDHVSPSLPAECRPVYGGHSTAGRPSSASTLIGNFPWSASGPNALQAFRPSRYPIGQYGGQFPDPYAVRDIRRILRTKRQHLWAGEHQEF